MSISMRTLTAMCIFSVFITSCGIFGKGSKKDRDPMTVALDTVTVDGDNQLTEISDIKDKELPAWLPPDNPKQATNTRFCDLIHTKLEIKPNFQTETMPGVATITLKPHFYDQSNVLMNAKHMTINSIKMNGKTLTYKYDSLMLDITLDRTYTSDEQFVLIIDYVSNPNNVPLGGSAVITGDKGLYFINAQGKEPNKPTQLWTQGETEDASCWFPTIDSPNQRCGHDIYLTVDKKYVTLSNGVLVEQKEDGNLRTDHWKQQLPIAPYLFMIAVGEFSITKDQWRGHEVNYYLEKDFHPYAKNIFGDTPEMIEFFSNRLGVDYPWDKYSQIVVRDYVSGAMENVGAVIHGEFVQQDDRGILDEPQFDIVSHELFHHWFGDLVTCESWSNLPLNESFATYGEYLWREHKYGRIVADEHLEEDLSQYLNEAQNKREPLIRYQYSDKEDMFDGHSYQKGGLTLHMLRNIVGDKAFFTSLKTYLDKNRFKSVEIHDLRLAFEEVTGQDLRWFFDQSFLQRGHAEIILQYAYDKNTKSAMVRVNQVQNDEFCPPAYRLPTFVDLYFDEGKTKVRKPVTVYTRDTILLIPCEKEPEYITFDPENTLLMNIKEDYSTKDYRYILRHDPTFRNRLNALRYLSLDNDAEAEPEIFALLSDKTSAQLRIGAIREYSFERDKKNFTYKGANKDNVIAKLKELAEKDPYASVRGAALEGLLAYADKDMIPFFEARLQDRSYEVFSTALNAIILLDTDKGYLIASKYKSEKNPDITISVANAIAEGGKADDFEWMDAQVRRISLTGDENCYAITEAYDAFLNKINDKDKAKAIETLKFVIENRKTWWAKIAAVSSLVKMKKEPGVAEYIEKLKQTEKNMYIQAVLSQ